MHWFFYFLLSELITIIYGASLIFKTGRLFDAHIQPEPAIQPTKERPGKGGTGAQEVAGFTEKTTATT